MNVDPKEPFDWKKWDLAMKMGVMPTRDAAERPAEALADKPKPR